MFADPDAEGAPPRYDSGPQRHRRMRAGDMLLGAERCRVEAALVHGGTTGSADSSRAEIWTAQARSPLEVVEPATGGELLPEAAFGVSREMRNTLDNPDYVAADASRDRLQLAHDAGVLELAADAADTIQAGNSIERMLAHQMAAAHHSAMHLTQQLNATIERLQYSAHEESRERASVQTARLAGSITRMMASFQAGALTMQRLKTGGRQQVMVRHVYQQVTVEEGGQAVVAGEVKAPRGGRRARDVR